MENFAKLSHVFHSSRSRNNNAHPDDRSSISQAISQADSDWTYRHFYRVLDDLMPMQGVVGSYVVYRAHSESHIPEYWFSIGYDANENGAGMHNHLSAHVRIADTDSIFGQIMRAHHNEPLQAIAAIEKTIRLKSFELKEMNCPAMKQQVEILDKIEVNIPKFHDPDVFVFGHPLRSEFHIGQDFKQMSVALLDDDKVPKTPLLDWAYSTRRALDTCAQAH